MGKIKVNNNGGSGGGKLDLVELGEHNVGELSSRKLKTYIGTSEVTDLCIYTPKRFITKGSQTVNIELGGAMSASKTIYANPVISYFTYTGDYEFYDTDHKILILKSSGTFGWTGEELEAHIIGGGMNGGAAGSAGGSGGNGGQVVTLNIEPSTSNFITIGAANQDTVAFGQTATAGGGAKGGIGTYSTYPGSGEAGPLLTFGSVSFNVAGAGGGAMYNRSRDKIRGLGGAGGGGDAAYRQYDYPSKAATPGKYYGAGGGGGVSDSGPAAGYQGAVFLYNGNEFIPNP